MLNHICYIGRNNDCKNVFCEGSTMSFKLTAAFKTDVGQQREQNEDNAYAQLADNREVGLFIVADGMGGYQAGEVASRIAVEKIREALKTFFVPVYDQP